MNTPTDVDNGIFVVVEMKSIRKTSTSKYLDQLKRKSCACGDPLCNRIGEFLGHVVTMKCGYRRSSEFEDEQKKRKKVRGVQIKRKRCELIHEEIVAMRRRFLEDKHERARKYTQTQISKEPAKSSRFNEIHYPIAFLQKMKNAIRLPMGIEICEATLWGMYREDFLYHCTHSKRKKVLVVPTLGTHQAIQVVILIQVNSRGLLLVEFDNV